MAGPIGFVIVESCRYAEARVTVVGSPKSPGLKMLKIKIWFCVGFRQGISLMIFARMVLAEVERKCGFDTFRPKIRVRRFEYGL